MSTLDPSDGVLPLRPDSSSDPLSPLSLVHMPPIIHTLPNVPPTPPAPRNHDVPNASDNHVPHARDVT